MRNNGNAWGGAGIRDHVVQAVELKFNCFFLMPVVDSFPTRLREELESAYDDDIDEVFDVTAVRNALESRLKALESELHQVRESSSTVELGCECQIMITSLPIFSMSSKFAVMPC